MNLKCLYIQVMILGQISIGHCLISQESVTRSLLTIGESLDFDSNILNEERTLNVYLPESYHDDSTKNYPVIYLLDGSKKEDLIHISGLVQFASFPWVKMIPESIVVGIGNVDRQRDFTQPSTNTEDIESLPTSGGSTNFINCLKKEIIPIVQSNFRTTESKSIIGQSLGGLLVTEVLFTSPSLFDNYIIISPSLWWNNQFFLSGLTSVKESNLPTNIYIAVGKEGKIMEESASALYQKLENLENPNLNIKFKYFESQNHGNILHLAAYDAFQQLFAESENVSSISHEQALKDLIINSFNDILSNHDSTKLKDYYTDDFLLLEDGALWNLDTVRTYLQKANSHPSNTTRTNKFDFIDLKIQGSMAWVAYQNWATFVVNGEVVRQMHWLESAVMVYSEGGWKIQQLHSTVVEKE